MKNKMERDRQRDSQADRQADRLTVGQTEVKEKSWKNGN